MARQPDRSVEAPLGAKGATLKLPFRAQSRSYDVPFGKPHSVKQYGS